MKSLYNVYTMPNKYVENFSTESHNQINLPLNVEQNYLFFQKYFQKFILSSYDVH